MALVSQIWLHLLLCLCSSAPPAPISLQPCEDWLGQAGCPCLGGGEEGAAVGGRGGRAAGRAPLQAVRARRRRHRRRLRQRHVVEVGQADVVPEALAHVHPVVQRVQLLGDVAPDQDGEEAGDEAVFGEQQVELLSPPGHVPTICLCCECYLEKRELNSQATRRCCCCFPCSEGTPSASRTCLLQLEPFNRARELWEVS